MAPRLQGGDPRRARRYPNSPNPSAMGFNNANPLMARFNRAVGSPMDRFSRVGNESSRARGGSESGRARNPGLRGDRVDIGTALFGGKGVLGPTATDGKGTPDDLSDDRGPNPNMFLAPDYEGNRDPMAHLRYWAKRGWVPNQAGDEFRRTDNVQRALEQLRQMRANRRSVGPVKTDGAGTPNPNDDRGPRGGGGGGGKGPGGPGGGGGGGGQGPGNWPDLPDIPGLPDDILQQLGLPLDPIFRGELRGLNDLLNMEMTNVLNGFNVGEAGVNLQDVLGNRAIDENMAARGLFGSGIERRDERVFGNELAQQRLGLQNDRMVGESSAQMDFYRGLMQALQELAARSADDRRAPIPRF